MSLNATPSSERKHIAFFGCRNAGKSSLLNAITGQELAIVSDVKGTTTDPVLKAIELLPAGPVVIIDTPGLDDEGELGQMRVSSALKVLRKTDVAVIVIDATIGQTNQDKQIIEKINNLNIPNIVVYNKADLDTSEIPNDGFKISSKTGEGINELKEMIAKLATSDEHPKPLVGDLVNKNDVVLLVVPIDKAAPKGRLILPQQQTIRDLLDHGAIPIVTRDSELQETIDKFKDQIKLVITDSQAFKKVESIIPKDMPLTSFSILFSRYKGELYEQLEAIKALDTLKDGDYILIGEGCSHHRQCGDIGTQKIPALLSKLGKFNIEFTSGHDFPEDLSKYKLVIHCGGCMLTEREMKARIYMAQDSNVPITNYGMFLAKMSGVLERSVKPVL